MGQDEFLLCLSVILWVISLLFSLTQGFCGGRFFSNETFSMRKAKLDKLFFSSPYLIFLGAFLLGVLAPFSFQAALMAGKEIFPLSQQLLKLCPNTLIRKLLTDTKGQKTL